MKTFTSVDNVLRNSEELKKREARAQARRMPLEPATIAESLNKQADSKIWLIEQHSRNRPHSWIEARRVELAALVQARDLLRGGASAAQPPG